MIEKIDSVDLTRRLIECRSVTPADDGALDIVASELEKIGFTIHRLRFEGGGSYPVDNIFARIGTASPHICFMGHTDVVPPGNEADWKHAPFDADILDGILYGRGAADMKSGVAASIAAASHFLSQHSDFTGSISFLITGDEEADSINGSEKVVKWLIERNEIPDFALVAEPSNPSEMGELMRVGRRGSFHIDLAVKGKQGHSAYPDRYINPVDKLVRLLYALINLKLDDGSDLMPPSHIAITSADTGNPARNVVANRATAHINIRFNDLWTPATLETKIRETLDATGVDYDMKTACNADSFVTISLDWAETVAKAAEKISGRKPVFDTGGGTSDARFIGPYCPVVEYGVITATNHQVDEHMRVSDITTLTDTYTEVLRSIFVK